MIAEALGRRELSRLRPAPRPALRADRLLGCRPLARPDRRRPTRSSACAWRSAASSRARACADVELVIFDTHGESIGRGGHPESFADRLDYVDTPAARAALARLGIACKQEVSFQGGDGYVYFSTPRAALTALTRILEHALTPPGRGRRPVLRRDRLRPRVLHRGAALQPADHGRSLLRRAARRLRRQPAAPLGLAPGASASTTAGRARSTSSTPRSCARSRTTRSSSSSATSPTASAASARRSPRTPSASSASTRNSPRFRRLMTMVEHAFKYSDLTVLKAYIDLFDPGPLAAARGAARRGHARRGAAGAGRR